MLRALFSVEAERVHLSPCALQPGEWSPELHAMIDLWDGAAGGDHGGLCVVPDRADRGL